MHIKTLHGAFYFSVQRLGSAKDATTWLEHTGQVCHGYLSERLAEFAAYYSNRLSYEEVARLIERVRGCANRRVVNVTKRSEEAD